MKYDCLSKMYYKERDRYEALYNERFSSESACHFPFKVNDYDAFVVIGKDILELTSKIWEINSDILDLRSSGTLPEKAIEHYIKKCMIDEIKQTNDIEGVYSTRRDINDILDGIISKENNRLKGIVNRYKLLLNDEIPIETCADIRKLYDELVLEEVKENDEQDVPDGEIFRQDTVEIRSANQQIIHEGLYPEKKIIDTMSSCLSMLSDDEYNDFVKIAVFHYMIGYIHPFYNGNGRLSRFISSYLFSKKLVPLLSYRLAYIIRKNLDAYYKSFKIANDDKNKGELTSFVISFLELVSEAMIAIKESLEERRDKFQYYAPIVYDLMETGVLENSEKSDNILKIFVTNALFGDGDMTLKQLREETEYSDYAIKKQLQNLIDTGIIDKKESKPHRYNINLQRLEELRK